MMAAAWWELAWVRWAAAGAAVLASLPVGLALAAIGRAALRRIGRDPSKAAVRALRLYLALWLLLGGIAVATQFAPLLEATRGRVERAVGVAAAAVLACGLAQAAVAGIALLGRRANLPIAVTNITKTLVTLLVLSIGLLLVLQNLGVEVTPLLTALGVGSLAIPLALGPTLSNLFSGIALVGARIVRPGDYVELCSGEKGYVLDVGWRHTRIRELANNVIIIANSRLAEEVVKNYHLPEKPLAVLVPVGVSYRSDLEQVERVTVEVARDVLQTVQGGDASFEPFIRYHTFGASSIDFTVILRGLEFVDQYLLKHEFVKRLHRRYREEGIEIPFPQRVVHTERAS